MARSTKAAAPTATSTLVRRPAVRCRYCRSAPISVPSTKATARLSSVSKKSAVWKVVRNFIAAAPGSGDLLQFQQARVTLFVGKSEQRALRIPGQRRDRRPLVAADQDFRAVIEADHQHGAVAVAGRHDVLLRMTGHHGDARLQRRQHCGLLAHRAVLAGEGPDND